MVAVDTSTLIAYIQGEAGADVDLYDERLAAGDVSLPAVVLTEILSEPKLPTAHRALILALPVLETLPDFWIRAADSRAALLSRKLRAGLSDTLIAQSCIDHKVPLIARDGDFRHFARHCGLKLA